MRLKVAFRNTFRNKRRTVINVAMIAGGVSALIVFNGFARTLMDDLREVTVQTQTGHLQVATPAYWNKTAKTPKDGLLPKSQKWIDAIERNSHVKYATGRLSFYGLLSRGDQTLSAQGVSYDPTVEGSRRKSYHLMSGKLITSANSFQIVLGVGLATRIQAKPGDRMTVLTQTFDGVVNALDMEVAGIFRTAISEFDDTSFLIPFKATQKLLDTDRVEQIVVGLDSTENTDRVLTDLRAHLGPSVRVKPWYSVAKLYNQVVAFNGLQTRIIASIIMALILLGIMNTIGMSIFERTGEIGTLAALGETGQTILWQFVLEGFVLGVIGGLAGVVLGAVFIELINYAKFKVVVPGATAPLILGVRYYFSAFRDALLLSVVAATLAAFFPALRASRMNIAEALRRSI